MTIRLVATDLDGTLWGKAVEVRPRIRAAIAELERRGVVVLAATGRRPRSARVALGRNELVLAAVCLDGTFGEDFATGVRFHEELFEPDAAAAVLDAFESLNVAPNVFVDHPEIDVLLAEAPSHRPDGAETLADWAQIGPLKAALPQHRAAAFTVIGGDHAVLAPVALAARATGFARATLTADSLYGGTSLSVVPSAASKWAGVLSFAARHGIDAAEILAVGDAANDLEMLHGAAIAVVVRTAVDEVRATADHLIDPPDEDGWAALIDLIG